jgi:uncharacterized protein (DUF2236 family)
MAPTENDASRSTSGDSLFAPDSVTWRLHGDPIAVVGGMRALLVQALNPLAMAGVDQHSDFRSDPWGRFQRTAGFVNLATFGPATEARAMGATVQRIHRTVTGTDPVTGGSYRADDPELLAWIHNVLAHSMLTAKRRYGGGISSPDADRYLREMVVLAQLVGTPAELVPTTEAGLRRYLRSTEPVMSDTVREASRTVLTPPLPLAVRPLWAVLDAAAIGLLPTRIRRMYGFPRRTPADAAVRAAATTLFTTLRLVLPGPPERRQAERRQAA